MDDVSIEGILTTTHAIPMNGTLRVLDKDYTKRTSLLEIKETVHSTEVQRATFMLDRVATTLGQ